MDKNNNLLLLLVASLLFGSMIVNSQCRQITRNRKQEEKRGGDDDDVNVGMSRDEIVEVAGYGEDKLSTVLITGTLAVSVCDNSCLAAHQQPKPISGALVGATCHSNSKDSLAKKTVTDKYGEFIIDLPSHLHSISDLEKLCSITILELPRDTACHKSDIVGKTNNEIELVSIGNGIRTYTTGRMVFQQSKSQVCILKADQQEMSWTW